VTVIIKFVEIKQFGFLYYPMHDPAAK